MTEQQSSTTVRTSFKLSQKATWNFFKAKYYGSRWASSAATFGAIGGLAVIYLTDWTVVASKIPFYGGKFYKEAEEE